MISKKVDWDDFKYFVDNRELSVQYIEFEKYYFLVGIDGAFTVQCPLKKTDPASTEQSDFETNYLPYANIPLEDRDQNGRTIIRTAATRKGWHYQAHSIQFELNKLNSTYNKDADENDLGFASIKVYRSNGDECTTQTEADTYGCKTIVTWAPNYDFEVISGNVRQAVKETIDSYIYVQARVATGLPSPYDWLEVPFTQGGINMKYIGADEILKTDGRAAKLLKGTNGDHFRIIANYPSGLLSGNNHEMSIILETYKDPLV